MHLDQYPDKFKVLPPLCDMIGIAEESRSVVLSAVWKFIKTVGAQDKDDVTKLLPVGGLQKVRESHSSLLLGLF
jgi:SWI/SNF-related matrix-associated actin-dependent regulator of chromatin subfamily D